MNHSDSERIAAVLASAGIRPAKNIDNADLLIINSCSVRQSAINRIYGQLINFRKSKKHGKTILTGCILETDKKKFKDKFDLIIDIKELVKNPEKLIGLLKIADMEFRAFEHTDYFKINPQYSSDFSAYIPIMTGCNNFCSYCAVPYTRGQEISRPAGEIIAEIKRLIGKGYKEITLLGQNVNSYISQAPNPKSQIPNKSQTNKKPIKFPELLKLINGIPGNFWIRFLTSHPKDMSDKLIRTMAQCKKVCEYIHLPVQSGDDRILQKMNRRYTATRYLKLIKNIRKVYDLETRFPSGNLVSKSTPTVYNPLAISTDIIVGFPGETKTQFANTAKIMRSVKFDMAYLAEYSSRSGTVAAKLEDNVPILEKKRRKEFLNDILRKTALANNKKYEGKIVEVLIEKVDDKFAYGKTRTFKNVRIQNPPQSPFTKGEEKSTKKIPPFKKGRLGGISLLPGQFAKVKITQAGAWGLEGKM